MADSRGTTMLRLAGNNERRCIVREHLGLYGSIVIAVSYRFPGRLTAQQVLDMLRPAVSGCQLQHPLLNGVVFQDIGTERPYLARTASNHDALPNITIWGKGEKTESEFLSEAASHSCIADPADVLPWRVNALIQPRSADEDSTPTLVAFVASHGLADGRSGIVFHNTLLAELNQQRKPVEANHAFPSAMEDRGKLSISPGFLLKPVLNEYLPSSLTRLLGLSDKLDDKRVWLGSATRPTANVSPKTCVEIVQVREETVSSMLKICRVKQVRLTGVLNHVICRALSSTLTKYGQDFTTFVVSTALDLRGVLSSPEQGLSQFIGMYAAGNDEVITPTSGEFDWNAAGRTTDELARASRTLSDQSVGLLKYLSNYKQWLLKKSQKPAESSVGMSNLGVFEPSRPDLNITADNIFFAQSGDITGEVINVNVASVKSRSLSIVFTWWPGMVGVTNEASFVHDVGQEVTRLFTDLSSTESSESG